MKTLVQGAYSADWMRMNMARKVSRSLPLPRKCTEPAGSCKAQSLRAQRSSALKGQRRGFAPGAASAAPCARADTDARCWCRLLLCVQDEFDDRRHYIQPRSTGATQGHALGAARTIAAVAASSSGGSHKQWKMKRFESKAQSRIVRYMYSQHDSSSSQQGEQQQQQLAENVAELRDQGM